MWFLKKDVLQAMRAARALGYEPTLEERTRFADQMREAYAAGPSDQPRNMQIAGSTAQINIEGVLTEKPDCFALLFGGGNTSYESIRKALALAEADPTIKNIVLTIASPGGHVNGLFETFAALDAATKPITVRASFAASAAYGIAAVAGPIEATTPAAEFGSIGVAASYFVDNEIVDIASTDAPKKRPDLSTDEGKAVVREELDALHELFASAIARGRAATTGEDVTLKTVNAEFGQGGMYTASAAKKRGMIDKLATQPKRTRMGRSADTIDTAPEQAPPPAAQGNTAPSNGAGRTTMNAADLKEKHPELHAQLIAEGEKTGETKERKRVNAHLKLGKASGAMDVAMKAIESGASVHDDDVHADYLAASMNRRDQANRQTESDDAAGATHNTETSAEGPDLGDKVVAILDAQRGKKPATKAS